MRLVLLVVGLAVASAAATAATDFLNLFKSWKSEFGKKYDSALAENKAFKTWNENRVYVEAVNAANLTWTAGLNKYADLTADEFARMVLLPKRMTPSKSGKQLQSLKVTDRPSEFDWRARESVVTSVKDQGSVGSCWAFSTIGNIEGQWGLHGPANRTFQDLSPEFLVDCDGSQDLVNKHADCSVFGGWPYLAFGYIIESGGVPSEQAWPYCSGTGDCYPCMQGPVSLCGPPPYYCDETIELKCPTAVPAAKISSWVEVSTDEEQIAESLYSQGPLSVLLDATQLQFYKSGVWTGHTSNTPPLLGCSKTYLNHAVLLVGYGNDIAVSDDTTPYWLVKNSWGLKWGEDGYFRIQRGQGTCGINTAVTTAIV